MDLTEHDVRRFSLLFVILALGVLTFFIIKPVLFSIIAGLVLSYMFAPVYEKLHSKMKSRNGSALLTSSVIIIVIVIPIWFIAPILLRQIFDMFSSSQGLNVQSIIQSLFPTFAPQQAAQFALALDSFIGKIVSTALGFLNNLFLDIPVISLHLILMFFVFFFALRDSDKLSEFISGLSPFTKGKEKVIVKQFKDVTDAVIYGQIIVGIVQGGLAGLGLLIFGVENVLVLTVLAIFLSILPILGPFIIWIPVAIYLFISGNIGAGIGYLIYNIVVVSLVDNILRTYLISRKTSLSPAIIFVSMVGGLLVFGVLGFLLGPLIVSYFLMFLKSFKERTLQSLISDS